MAPSQPPQTPVLVEDPWLGANPLDPGFRANPFPALNALREQAPLQQTPIGAWTLGRYDDVLRLLREVRTGMRTADGASPIAGNLSEDWGGAFMLQEDAPDHTRLRRLVSRAFTPRAIERLRSSVQPLARDLVERALERGELEAMGDLAQPVPAAAICEMLGVPNPDRERFAEWTAHMTHLVSTVPPPAPVLAAARAGAGELARYVRELIADKRRHLADDVLSDLIRAEEAGDRLSEGELLVQTIGLLVAGFETTVGLIGSGILTLLRNPDELARLRAEPRLLESAVEECLRYDGPVVFTVRVLKEPAAFQGRKLEPESQVWALLAAANRDPRRFPEPERFRVDRTPNPHLAFGFGAHVCLGAHLARMEAQAALGALIEGTRTMELACDELEWGPSAFRVLARLPIAVQRR